MRKRIFSHGAEFNSGCGKAYILCNECCGIILGRIGHKFTACVVEHDIMPLVINIDTAGFAHGKQHSLCLGVLIHRMVEVKVILREVRERTDGKVYARNTVQNERMRGYLHDDMRTACVRHLTEKLLELVALRRCTLGVDKLITYHITVRADKADLCVKLRFKQVLEKIGRRGLAVCAGYADDGHLRGGVAKIVAAEYRKSIAAVCHNDIGNVNLRLFLANYDRSTLLRCRRYVGIAVGLKACYRNEGVALLCLARIVTDAVYFGI